MASSSRPLALLLAAVIAVAGEAASPDPVFRAETINLSLRQVAGGGQPVADFRVGLIADLPRGVSALRLEAPRFRTVATDTGERLALLVRPSARVQDLSIDRTALRDRAVRLALDLTPPRDPVRRLLDLQGGVRLTLGIGPPRTLLVPLRPLPAKPLPVEGMDCAVAVEDLKNGRVAVVVPPALASRLGEPVLLDADGVAANPRPGQRSQPDGQPLRIQYDLGPATAMRLQLPWFPTVRTAEVAITIPALAVPGGLPGIGDATAPHPRPPARPALKLPLHRAVQDGDARAIDWLLLADASALERPEGDLRPVQRAAACGRSAQLARLLAAGAEPTARTRDGRSLLWLAVEAGDAESVRLLLACGVDVHETAAATGWNLLHAAVNADAPEVLREVLAAGVDPWAEAKDGRSAIDLARDQARWPMLRLMLGNP